MSEQKAKVANPGPLGLLGFGSLTVLFFLLSIGDFTGIHAIITVAGSVGIFCGLSAIYSAMGQILNAEFGKTVLPLG